MRFICVCGNKYDIFERNGRENIPVEHIVYCKTIPLICNCKSAKSWGNYREWHVIPALCTCEVKVELNEKQYIKTQLPRCNRCRRVYCDNVKFLEWALQRNRTNIIVENRQSVEYRIDAEFRKRKPTTKKNSIRYGVALISGDRYSLNWIADEKKDQDPERSIFYYASAVATRLLYGACFNQGTMMFCGKPHRVYLFFENKNGRTVLFTERSQLEIVDGNNGGYYTPNADVVRKIGMLPCASSDYLQFLKVSYDIKTGRYYADKEQYKLFSILHGRPIIGSITGENVHLNMNYESILHARGYNVNSRDNLSEDERHGILASVVEDGTLMITEVLHFLRRMMYLHEARHPEAAAKYREDYRFMTNYKAPN